MKAMNEMMCWIRIASLFLFISVVSNGCSTPESISEECKEVGMETWTNEFIRCMNAGCLPDDANRIAEVISVKILAQCMKENQ